MKGFDLGALPIDKMDVVKGRRGMRGKRGLIVGIEGVLTWD